MTYGICPTCGEPGISRERSMDGLTRCKNGHAHKHAFFDMRPLAPLPQDPMSAAIKAAIRDAEEELRLLRAAGAANHRRLAPFKDGAKLHSYVCRLQDSFHARVGFGVHVPFMYQFNATDEEDALAFCTEWVRRSSGWTPLPGDIQVSPQAL
jgi:hypothetical protein